MTLNARQVLDAMTFARDEPNLRPHQAAGRLLRIDRGAYLDPSIFHSGMPPWEINRTVTVARAHALARRVRAHNARRRAPLLTGEAALIATGAQAWNQNPPITYRDDVQRRPRKPFPPVAVLGHVVAARPAVVVGPAAPVWEEASSRHALVLPTPSVMMLDLGATLHPLGAYANTSILLGELVSFSNRNLQASREREADLKLRITSELSSYRGRNGIPRVRNLVRLADAGAGSVMEAACFWMLHCWIRPRVPWETQHRVVFDWQTYYADAAIPSCKVSIEFDGAEKLGADVRTWSRRSRAFLERASAFIGDGWRTISVPSSMMRNLGGAMWWLGCELEPFGVTRKEPGGPLWQELPEQPGRSTIR